MLERLRDERGMGMIEMIAAVVVITVALLALMASYDQAFFSLHNSARKTAAASLAETQLELYSSFYGDTTTTEVTGGTTTTVPLPVAQIGLNSSLLTTAKASDAFYLSDENALGVTGTDVTYSGCSTTTAQCEPVQLNVTGNDGKKYRVETFIIDTNESISCSGQTTSCGTTPQREVTVIVRDPNVSGTPKVYTATMAFDCGPRGSSTTTTATTTTVSVFCQS